MTKTNNIGQPILLGWGELLFAKGEHANGHPNGVDPARLRKVSA